MSRQRNPWTATTLSPGNENHRWLFELTNGETFEYTGDLRECYLVWRNNPYIMSGVRVA